MRLPCFIAINMCIQNNDINYFLSVPFIPRGDCFLLALFVLLSFVTKIVNTRISRKIKSTSENNFLNSMYLFAREGDLWLLLFNYIYYSILLHLGSNKSLYE